MSGEVPPQTADAVLRKTECNSALLQKEVKGYDWSNGIDYSKIFESYLHTGFQATNLGLAVDELNRMIDCRHQKLPEDLYVDPDDVFINVKTNCTIFLGYTSNIISSGLRETIKFLVQHNLVS